MIGKKTHLYYIKLNYKCQAKFQKILAYDRKFTEILTHQWSLAQNHRVVFIIAH